MRQKSAMMAWNVRAAKVGDSRERLTEAHLAIFRERYADLIRSLGYEVR
jgi:predicted PolB exonuclease-like 3'-5' exonuclease